MRWPGHRYAAVFFISVAAFVLLATTALLITSRADDEQAGTVLVVFAVSTRPADIFGKIILAGGKPVRPTWMPGTWIAHGDDKGFAGNLKNRGALGIYTSSPILPQLQGCFAYVDAKTVHLFAINQ